MLLELDDIVRAHARLKGRVTTTPTFWSSSLEEELGLRVHLKAELFQKTGSFKTRGVFNKLLSMDPADPVPRAGVPIGREPRRRSRLRGLCCRGQSHRRDAGHGPAIQG